MRSPRHAPCGASARPAASASATPPVATSTPAVLRALSRSTPNSAATTMVISASVEPTIEPCAAVVYDEGEIVEHLIDAEIHAAEQRHGEPVASPWPGLAQRAHDRQQHQERAAEAQRAERQRIDIGDDEARRRRDRPAEGRGEQCRQHADAFAHA